jgi:hypothetical protein
VDAAEVVEGSVGLVGNASAVAGGKDCVEDFDDKCGMGALGGMEIGFEAEMKIYGSGYEPDAFALSHLRRLFDLGKTEDAGVKGASAIFTGNGNGDLHVVEAEDWHG